MTLCQSRMVILSARFGALKREMDINIKDVASVIYACFVLHNFVKSTKRSSERTKFPQPLITITTSQQGPVVRKPINLIQD